MKNSKPNFQILILGLSGLLIIVIFLNIASIVNLTRNSKFETVVKDLEELPDATQLFQDNTTLVLVGDVMLGRTVEIKSSQIGDYNYPFRKIADKLYQAGLVFVNLENPIIRNCPMHSEGFKFCATPNMLSGLKYSGVDVVNLANNHSRNYSKEGLDETVDYLKNAGIEAAGIGNLVIKEVNGVKFGFMGFDFLSRSPTNKDFELVKSSDDHVDTLIVGVHWGVEYTSKPTKLQREWGKKLVENGADVVAGHHPHWVQESETINGVPIFYSMGNFIFDQMWSEETKKGIIVELTFKNKRLIEQKVYNTYMADWAQPEILSE